MDTARTALIEHIEPAAAELGLGNVAPYADEIERLSKSPGALTSRMPLALVIYLEGQLYGPHAMHVLVITRTAVPDRVRDGSDALALAERLAKWLEANYTFRAASGERFNILDSSTGGITVRMRKLSTSYTIADVGFVVGQS